MIIIRNKFIPFQGYKAINLFGILFVKNQAKIDDVTINHESIHSKQIREVMLSVLILTIPLFFFKLWWLSLLLTVSSYYLWYVIEYFIKGYKDISFEREAYQNEKDLTYLDNRKLFSFIKYIK